MQILLKLLVVRMFKSTVQSDRSTQLMIWLLFFTFIISTEFGNGVVRLYRNGVPSSSYYYGIVQIWYNGQWGNICDDDDYDQYEADVICHQLGYTGASRAGSMR